MCMTAFFSFIRKKLNVLEYSMYLGNVYFCSHKKYSPKYADMNLNKNFYQSCGKYTCFNDYHPTDPIFKMVDSDMCLYTIQHATGLVHSAVKGGYPKGIIFNTLYTLFLSDLFRRIILIDLSTL